MKRAQKLVTDVGRIGAALTAVAVLTQCSSTVDPPADRATASDTSERESTTTRSTTTSSTKATPGSGSTTPSSPTTTGANAGDPIDRAAVEAWLGEWTGSIEQPSASTPSYTVRLTLEHDGHTVVGTSVYPELDCTGTLGDADLDEDVLELEETIPADQSNKCATTDLELTLKPDEILYHFDSNGGGDGTLHRP